MEELLLGTKVGFNLKLTTPWKEPMVVVDILNDVLFLEFNPA